MTKYKNRRHNPDRRENKTKNFPDSKRQSIRRKEDKNNLITYYAVLALTLFILAAFGFASFFYSY